MAYMEGQLQCTHWQCGGTGIICGVSEKSCKFILNLGLMRTVFHIAGLAGKMAEHDRKTVMVRR